MTVYLKSMLRRARLALHVLRGRPLMYRIHCSPIAVSYTDGVLIAECHIDGNVNGGKALLRVQDGAQ